MKVKFKNNKIKKLYETGINKYKFPKQILKKFFKCIAIIEAAYTIHDLWKTPSLNFEKLQGYSNRYSMRLNDQYRLEVDIEWENEAKTEGIFDIINISSHYGGK